MSNYITNEDGTYVDLEYTQFPAQCDSWENSEDISASMIGPANQYRTFIENGNYADAQVILNNNPRLKNMLINADTINRMKQGIMAVQRMFKDTIESYVKGFMDKAKEYCDNALTYSNNAKESETNSANYYSEITGLIK